MATTHSPTESSTGTDGGTLRKETPQRPSPEDAVLRAIRELKYGTVEVVVHQGEIQEIRQTRRVRTNG